MEVIDKKVSELRKSANDQIANIDKQRKDIASKITGSGTNVEYNSIILRVGSI
jgi:hypothetical protein